MAAPGLAHELHGAGEDLVHVGRGRDVQEVADLFA